MLSILCNLGITLQFMCFYVDSSVTIISCISGWSFFNFSYVFYKIRYWYWYQPVRFWGPCGLRTYFSVSLFCTSLLGLSWPSQITVDCRPLAFACRIGIFRSLLRLLLSCTFSFLFLFSPSCRKLFRPAGASFQRISSGDSSRDSMQMTQVHQAGSDCVLQQVAHV